MKQIIYDNGTSNCIVKFDGEIVTLEQELEGIETNTIMLYADEFEKAYEFIKSELNKS